MESTDGSGRRAGGPWGPPTHEVRRFEGGLTVESGTGVEVDRCRAVLAGAFGSTRFSAEWFEWKHQHGPWGASRPVLATLPGGDVGACFALPWTFRAGGRPVAGLRLVDGGVTPAARGHGVLRAMVRHVLDLCEVERPAIVLATATPPARASHIRNGAVALPPIRYSVGLPSTLRTGRVITGDGVLDGYLTSADPRIGSDWTPDGLRWRMGLPGGHDHEAASLASSDGPNGLVYRIERRGPLRLLIPLLGWGDDASQAVLLASCMKAARAPVVLAPAGAGASDVPARWLMRRDPVLVCAWDRTGSTEPAPGQLDSWRLGGADVEGLV